MLVIPAIDISGGRCIRLTQGDFQRETVYHEDPLAIATLFQSHGAEWLHIVDLDGARLGESQNGDVIRKIVQETELSVQVGGGIRSLVAIESWLDAEVSRVIVGTMALRQPDVFRKALRQHDAGTVALALDLRKGKAAVEGWLSYGRLQPAEIISDFVQDGLQRVVVTDIERDGTLEGPNIEMVSELGNLKGIHVTLSGGVGSANDLRMIERNAPACVDSVIVGKAIYEHKLSLRELFRAGV